MKFKPNNNMEGEEENYSFASLQEKFMPLITTAPICNSLDDALILNNMSNALSVEKLSDDQNDGYVSGWDYSLVAKEEIQPNTILFKVGQDLIGRRDDKSIKITKNALFTSSMNDCMWNMKSIQSSETSLEMFDALMENQMNYYNFEIGCERVNCIVSVIDGEPYCVSRKVIGSDEEILRAYGFSTWMKEIVELNILKKSTLFRFFKYIQEFVKNHMAASEPYSAYLNLIIQNVPKIMNTVYLGKNDPSNDYCFAADKTKSRLIDDFDEWYNGEDCDNSNIQLTLMQKWNMFQTIEACVGEKNVQSLLNTKQRLAIIHNE